MSVTVDLLINWCRSTLSRQEESHKESFACLNGKLKLLQNACTSFHASIMITCCAASAPLRSGAVQHFA